MYTPMLTWHIGECLVSIVNINNNIKKPTRGYQMCNTNQMLICGGGDLKVGESLYQ